ncbi:MAG: hypothetical protein K2Y29_10765 [Beijerinckiaceae bacterium]|nr:hypothetical protein [Beijerinckiaceae bacterium]
MQITIAERMPPRLRRPVVQIAASIPLATVIYVASGSLALGFGVAALDLLLRPLFAAGVRRARMLLERTRGT